MHDAISSEVARIEKSHVVIVDDADDSRSLNQYILRDEGFEHVVGVASVSELLRHLAASLAAGDPVDVILMDINMPGTDGIEGTRQVRDIPVCRNVPILMLTSMDQAEILKTAFEAGAMDYVTKNSDPIELATRVRSALALKRESDSLRAREQELIELTRQLLTEREALKKTSYVDELTGLYHPRAFDRIARTAWEQGYTARKPLGLMLVGVDAISEYNLHHGKEAGDQLLRQVAALMPDNDGQTFSLRFEGSIFAVLLTESAENGVAYLSEKLLERMRLLRLPHDSSPIDTIATLSIGYTVQSPHVQTQFGVFLRIARQALVEAGKQGHDRAVRLNSLRESGPFRPL